MIVAEQVSVTLGGARILGQVSMRIEEGEVVAIIGANGAGKSTLMRTLTGDQSVHGGRVTIGGIEVARRSAERLARVRAFLPQSSSLDFPFTAFEVALLGRTPYVASVERPADFRIAIECLAAAGVEHLRDRRYPSLSGGERQRVQLARALAQIWDAPANRRCLLLDEPTASLDLTHQHTVLRLARRLADGGSTVGVVLHDVNLAARYADRLIVLERGRVSDDGPPARVLTPHRLASAFDVRATVIPHPEHDCPLVVALEPN